MWSWVLDSFSNLRYLRGFEVFVELEFYAINIEDFLRIFCVINRIVGFFRVIFGIV